MTVVEVLEELQTTQGISWPLTCTKGMPGKLLEAARYSERVTVDVVVWAAVLTTL
jgi:hypothetical protein